LFYFVPDAEKPNYGQGTLIAVPLLAKGAESGSAWNAVLESSNENVIRVKVTDSIAAEYLEYNVSRWSFSCSLMG
jgi:hypothetical protein